MRIRMQSGKNSFVSTTCGQSSDNLPMPGRERPNLASYTTNPYQLVRTKTNRQASEERSSQCNSFELRDHRGSDDEAWVVGSGEDAYALVCN